MSIVIGILIGVAVSALAFATRSFGGLSVQKGIEDEMNIKRKKKR